MTHEMLKFAIDSSGTLERAFCVSLFIRSRLIPPSLARCGVTHKMLPSAIESSAALSRTFCVLRCIISVCYCVALLPGEGEGE